MLLVLLHPKPYLLKANHAENDMREFCSALYGALYYYRLGEFKGLPEQPPPPPEPSFMPFNEMMGPWIKPMAFTPQPTPQVHATKFDAALAATVEAAKAPEGSQANSGLKATAKKTTGPGAVFKAREVPSSAGKSQQVVDP